MRDELGDLGCHFMVEPGRLIAGNAGLMVAKTLFVKEGSTRTFVILDAAMNDLMRPALYDAYHGIQPVTQPLADAPLRPMDVVGPVCETGDTFAKNRPLPPIKDGDLVAFRTAGAYGAVMAGTYNSRPLIPEVMVDGADYHVVRRRVTIETMLAWESLPDWLGEESTDPGGRSAAE
ncbi:MAG: diaminopimelate decarboxylase family protein [Rhodospirillales bacterium]